MLSDGSELLMDASFISKTRQTIYTPNPIIVRVQTTRSKRADVTFRTVSMTLKSPTHRRLSLPTAHPKYSRCRRP